MAHINDEQTYNAANTLEIRSQKKAVIKFSNEENDQKIDPKKPTNLPTLRLNSTRFFIKSRSGDAKQRYL